jgi:histidinol-phosphate/aromatic aminotransferase/cobyric acid decarboxylase-like protein
VEPVSALRGDDFIAAVSEATGWPAEGILVGNGSNELIQALLAPWSWSRAYRW